MNILSRAFPTVLTLMLLLSSCAPAPSGRNASGLSGRTGPVYVQWMEEQACLRRAAELTAVVSGSSLGWKRSALSSPFPEQAGTWFHASGVLTAWSGQDAFLQALVREHAASRLAALGVQGIFLSGLADTGDEWAGRSPAAGLGEDATSLYFGRLAGTENDYQACLEDFSRAGLLTGGVLLPAHTGTGPDFFLSTRAVRDYPGLYAMTELPRETWHLLPSGKADIPSPTDASFPRKKNPRRTGVLPLSRERISALIAAGLLPSALVQDNTALTGTPRGWAVTAPVAGVDGVERRWAYRWYESPDRPVLHWDDPSGAARRILQASLIQQIGLRHQILAAVSIGAWMGLDADLDAGTKESRMTPGLPALQDLARNARRYGATLLVEDAFPLSVLADLQDAGAGFFFDSALFPALERSLLQQNAAPLRESLNLAMTLGIDQRKLWRKPADGSACAGASHLLPLLPDDWKALLVSSRGCGRELRINAPTLAAVICGLTPGARPDGDMARRIRDIHLLQIATRAFLPGLLMLSGADLDGGLPDGEDWRATPPLWQLNALPTSRQGLPSGYALYRHLPASEGMEEPLSRILHARASTSVASAELAAVPSCDADAVLAAASVLPDGGHLVFFGNFSGKEVSFRPDFPQWNGASRRSDVLSGRTMRTDALTLPPWGWQAVLLR